MNYLVNNVENTWKAQHHLDKPGKRLELDKKELVATLR